MKKNDTPVVMQAEVEENYQYFLEAVEHEGYLFGAYLDEDEYEYEYCHRYIEEAQGVLKQMITDYLVEHHPGKFLIFIDWCVHVMSVEYARKHHETERTIRYCTVPQAKAEED